MANFKVPMGYNYSPSYHAYAYGLRYPRTPEQTHANRNWTESAYGSSVGVPGSYYTPQPPPSQTPPGSPERNNPTSGYPGSVVCYANPKARAQTGRVFFPNNRLQFGPVNKSQERASSDTPSDSEAHTPDSWSSGSSREGGIAQVDAVLPNWVKTSQTQELDTDSPNGSKVVSSSVSAASEGPACMNAESGGVLPEVPTEAPSPKPVETAAPPQPRKAKARTAFSEEQMSALNDRFNVQRYLTPAEMKTLAGFTGLTYKQVKTWFQNRRMKLKRHQKDNSWVSERYITGIPNAQAAHSQFQVDAPILTQDLYNHQFRDAVFKSPPQAPSFYLNYSRQMSPSQASSKPQGGWCMSQAVQHYDFLNPANYVPVGGNAGPGDVCVDPGSTPAQMATVHGATQWSS